MSRLLTSNNARSTSGGRAPLLALLVSLALGCLLWQTMGGALRVAAAPAGNVRALHGSAAATVMQVAATGATHAPVTPTVRLLGQIGGPLRRVVTQGDYTYAATPFSVAIFNTSNPLAPRREGFILLDWLFDIEVAGNYLYATLWENQQLAIIDIADPTAPRLVRTVDLPGLPDGMVRNGQLLYILSFLEGIQVVNLADPLQAAIVNQVEPRTSHKRGAVRNQLLYTVTNNRFRIFTLANPTAPALLSELGITDGRDIRALLLAGDVAYLSQYDQTFVVDISNAAAPRLLAPLPVGNAFRVDGNYLYATPPVQSKQLTLLTLDDPRQPISQTTIPINYAVADLQIHNQVATLATDGGLLLYDLTKPTAPQRLSRWWGGTDTRQAAFVGNYAFLRDGWLAEMALLDLSNPLAPLPVATFAVPARSEGLAVQGDWVYVGRQCDFPCRSGFTLYTQPTPLTLREVGSYVTPIVGIIGGGPAQAFAFAGARGYIATTGSGVRAVDLRTPTQPVDLGGYPASLAEVDLALAGETLYLGHNQGFATTLQIFDVANASQPTLMASLPLSNGHDLALQGHLLYVADRDRANGKAGLRIIDVTNPAQPRQLGQLLFELARNAQAVAVDGDLAYVAVVHEGSGIDTLRVIDVSDPTQPRQIDSFELSGVRFSGLGIAEVKDVAVVNGLIYVSEGNGGLFILAYPTSAGVDSRLVAPPGVPVAAGQVVTIPIGINNSGSVTATGGTISVTLPAGVSYVGSNRGAPAVQGQTLRWPTDSLAPFAPQTMNLAVKLSTSLHSIVDYPIKAAIVTGDDTNQNNNQVIVTLHPLTGGIPNDAYRLYLPVTRK